MTLNVKDLRTDGGTQPRAAVDFKLVADYAEAMQEGTTFPPVTAFYDGTDYWLADGFHRLFAAKKIKAAEINAEVMQGTRRDAILHSFGVNETHGFRRTADDKRRAVIRMLQDDEWSKLSLNQIAKACKVSVGLAHKVFHDPAFDFSREKSTERKGADGRAINTANIGKAQPSTQQPVRHVSSYSPKVTPDEPEEDDRPPYDPYGDDDRLEVLQPDAEVISEKEEVEEEPYIPPYVSNPIRPTYEVKPLSNAPKPKDPPFVIAYTQLGKLRSMGHRTLIDGINSIENQTQEHALENQVKDVIEMLRASLKQAEIERKTVTA